MLEKKETKAHPVNKAWTENVDNVVNLVLKVCLARWDPVVNPVSRDHPVYPAHQVQEVFQESQDQRVTWVLKENQVLPDNKVLLDHKVFQDLKDQWVHPVARDHLENQACLVFQELMDFQDTPDTRVLLDLKAPWEDPDHQDPRDILDLVVLREKVASEESKVIRETKVSMV